MKFNDEAKERIKARLIDARNYSDNCLSLFSRIDEPIALVERYVKEANGREMETNEWEEYLKALREAKRVINALAHIEIDTADDLRTLLKCESDPELAEECSDLFDIYEEIINP